MDRKDAEKLTIDEIARLAFVSRSVVSRVLNNRANVSEAARRRVLDVIEQYNYTPSAAARSLVTHRSYEVSVLVPRKADEVLANAYWPLLLLGITEECNRRGYLVSLSMLAGEMGAILNRRILAGHHFDGYLIVSKQVVDLVRPSLLKRRIPALLVGHDDEHPELSAVDVDNEAGAYRGTVYLLGLGHRRIAAITGPLETQETRDRLAGFQQAHREAGRGVPPDYVVEAAYSEQSGYEAMRRLLAAPAPPTAVFCMNDAMATGALLAIDEAGLAVPADVSVLGYDDLPASAYTTPPLTTVRQPVREMGRFAAGSLIDVIEGRSTGPVREQLSATLVVRRSCAPPASPGA